MTDYGRLVRSNSRSSAGLALTFLFIGLGIGAVSALMFTPKTGKQVRRNLRRRYEDALETLGEWGESAEKTLERGSTWASDVKDRARSRVTPIARAVRG